MQNIIELTPDNFQKVLAEDSFSKLVVVAFWADSVAESVEYMPTVQAIAAEYASDIIVATVDCVKEQQLAMQFGVQHIPTLALVKEGKPLGGLPGQQSIEQIRELLTPHLPKVEDNLLQQAVSYIDESNFSEAYTLLCQAIEIAPERVDIQKKLINACLNIGKDSDAELLLQNIKMVDQDDEYHSLLATLELNKQAADTPEIKALELAIQQDSNNTSAVVQLAIQLHQVKRDEEALNLLFILLKKDLSVENGEGKKVFMDILQAAPAGDPVATSFRRKLYSLLY
ncbi:tetratricopeptide repeat protein [Algibacillus agarilyticus]|uniref:tetratricopeptide repeat protein n=1 Tax=Algibacillus agarilyticus TaxID=2234133 RepID=UPI000DD0E48C|nr:tetratricopeptide repeat protein [Algibacillus agarilyticus]